MSNIGGKIIWKSPTKAVQRPGLLHSVDDVSIIANYVNRTKVASIASLWELLHRGDYDKTISMTDKLLANSYEAARAKEEELQQGEVFFPNGEVPEEERWKIDANVSLNEVAIGLFIKGQAAVLSGDLSLAEESYLQAESLPHARCWDPNGWYWSPAVAAADHRRKMKSQESSLPANVAEIRELNKKIEALKTSGLALAKQRLRSPGRYWT